jgi:vitamin B12 transporter
MVLLALAVDLVLRGTVRDQAGLPVPRALVYVDGTQNSTDTDAMGRFELTVSPARAGTLMVYRDGFEAVPLAFDPLDPLSLDALQIVLVPAGLAEVVTVAAPRVGAPPASTFALRPLDVVRTPGSAADLMRALQTLPGVAQIDEGAGLYVRGGDSSEVLVLLDDAIVFHPYRSETPGGGLFGSVEPFLLEGASFATGGFSAKYGNAMSAVLDLHGLARPEMPQLSVTLGLAAASMRAAIPIGSRAGLRLSGNRSFPGLLFAVNGRPYEFNRLPGGWDVNGSAHYDSPSAGHFKIFVNAAGDHVGVHVDSLSFGGQLASSTDSTLGSIHWTNVIGPWLAMATAGISRYTRGNQVGVLDLAATDLRGSWRASAERAIDRWIVRAGIDRVDARTQVRGIVPARGGDLGGVSGTIPLDVDYDDAATGAYAETERRLGVATMTAGARMQHFDLAGQTAVDPRVNVVIDTAPHQRASFAWGIYRQAPDAAYYGFVGSGGLQAMRARHLVTGYEAGSEKGAVHVRAEAYWKRYDALPLEIAAVPEPHGDADGIFVSDGYGSAHGIDLFSRVKRRKVDVVADYSWLAADRRWTSFLDRGRFSTLPAGTWSPDFDIPHTAHVLARVDLTRRLSTSTGWRIFSGRPVTPVVGAVRTASGFSPVYGPINSERLPHYARTDLTVSYLSQITGLRSAILFASVGNAFARTNAFEYAYSSDFSTRRPVTTATPRVFYFGITLTR